MPIYDFKCKSCNSVDEYYVPLTTSLPINCKCGKECELEKVKTFNKNKPILKGNGFYETDYKNK
jgi:putative FmdB family regulatory protein